MHLLEEATHKLRYTSSILESAHVKLEFLPLEGILACVHGLIHPVVELKKGAHVYSYSAGAMSCPCSVALDHSAENPPRSWRIRGV